MARRCCISPSTLSSWPISLSATILPQDSLKLVFVATSWDYNLALLDRLEGHPLLAGVGCTNELNCSLAAEGYARANGIGVCVVTYGVGAFSAFNGVGSAYAEGFPIILISGSPNPNDIGRHLMNHSLGDYDLTYQLEMAKKITCCALSIRNAEHAPEIIDRVVQECMRQRKPGYIELPANLASSVCPRPRSSSTTLRHRSLAIRLC